MPTSSDPQKTSVPTKKKSSPVEHDDVKGPCPTKHKAHLQQRVIEELRKVFDPEIPVSIYDLGLIYKVEVFSDNSCHIVMTLTSPSCPVAESLPSDVEQAAKSVEGIGNVVVELTFDPPWDISFMSEAAQLELGLL